MFHVLFDQFSPAHIFGLYVRGSFLLLFGCATWFCYLARTLTTASEEGTQQQFLKSLKHSDPTRWTLLYINDTFACHGGTLCLPQPASHHVSPQTCPHASHNHCSHPSPLCCLFCSWPRYGLISVPAWNAVIRAFRFVMTGCSALLRAGGHPHTRGLFVTGKLSSFFFFCSPAPTY